MEGCGDSHYVSFLSGESGGFGRNRRKSSRASGRAIFQNKLRALTPKFKLLAAAVTLSFCLLCVLFYLQNSHTNVESDIYADYAPVDGSSDANKITRTSISVLEWPEEFFVEEFAEHMNIHKISYASVAEKMRKFKIFKNNLVYIHTHNAQGHSYSLAMNKFGDMSRDEFKEKYLGLNKSNPKPNLANLGVNHSLSTASPLPASVDWRARGCVTPVKNQRQCGSCWSFSATGAIEGAVCAKTGRLFSLSEQMLMDCSGPEGNRSCNGGMMDDAFVYVEKHGLCLEKDYPYEAKDDLCRENQCKTVTKLQGFYDVPPSDEKAMKAALANHGAVSIAIQADQVDFQFYQKGIFNAPCGTDLDHGVLLVGYGEDPHTKKEFFIMKNSWGPEWGDGGYMYMAQHQGNDGECGLLLNGSYPIVSDV